MNCHECAVLGVDQRAVALCRFCSVGLCKSHLVEAYRRPPTVPTYSCAHEPWRSASAERQNVDIGEKRWMRTSA